MSQFRQLMQDPFVQNEHMTRDEADDPVRRVIEWAIHRGQEVFGKLPERASPLAHALDVEYRERLNVRIAGLKQQVGQLERDVLTPKTSSSSSSSP